MNTDERRLIAVDVGNARMKLGMFRDVAGGAGPRSSAGLPEPEEMCAIDHRTDRLADKLAAWIAAAGPGPCEWWIGSVNRPAAARLIDWLRANRPDDAARLLSVADLPLRVEVARPERVGVDRLLNAVAANHLRQPDRPAIVVDVGTGITVDLISADGAFRGGAILPGMAMSARALHEFTDLLPLVDVSALAAPPSPLGTSTETAIQSGLFWGAVGQIREVTRRMIAMLPAADDRNASTADMVVTGGGVPTVAGLLGFPVRHVRHLTLAGILLAARAMRS